MTKLQTLAKWYASRMITDKRYNGDTFYKFKDDLPRDEEERCRALAMDAHDNAGMLPDDWRYEFISHALDALVEYSDPDDIQLEPDVYTSELTGWLHSRNSRSAYCDDAVSEYGIDDATMFDRMQYGQLMEKNEVLASVRAYLENEVEDEDEADDDEQDQDQANH